MRAGDRCGHRGLEHVAALAGVAGLIERPAGGSGALERYVCRTCWLGARGCLDALWRRGAAPTNEAALACAGVPLMTGASLGECA